MFLRLKTIDRITAIFSLYNFVSLVILLLVINITYFFIWYNEQKQLSFHDMDMTYNLFSMPNSEMEISEFTSYLLERDTLIIPDEGTPICSEGVEKKVHENLALIQDNFFFSYEGKTYFIFSAYYEKIGLVKVLFDTTPYVHSQIIIIKISFIFIILFSFFSFFIGKVVSKNAFSSLMRMTKEVQQIHLDSLKKITVPDTIQEDELRIFAEAMNMMIEKITHQTRNLKQFITDVSHEFKTPLMSMNSYLDVLQKKSEKGKDISGEILENTSYLKQNIKKMNGLLETLFYLTKIEEGIQKVELEKVQIGDFFEQKISQMKIYFPKIIFTLRGESLEKISYDVNKNLLEIVVENLLSNAAKFAGENEKVDIVLSDTFFMIQDYGQGIEDKKLKHIWDKFYKIDSQKEGFGVGLFLVKRICDVCNWKIQVSSTPKKGTLFTLYI